MGQNKVRIYLLYAIGEITLVMIGILLALQVSNWNQERAERNQLLTYYSRIHEELSDQLIYLEERKESVETLIRLNKKSIELYNANNPDSLSKLVTTIGSLGTAWTPDYSFPNFDEFLSSEYFSKVQNIEIKKKLRTLKSVIVSGTINSQFTINQYQSVIEPYIIKNLNYQNSAMPNYQEYLIPGGPKTDYSKFQNDLEFWNILSLKHENIHLSKRAIVRVEVSINELLSLLNQELSK